MRPLSRTSCLSRPVGTPASTWIRQSSGSNDRTLIEPVEREHDPSVRDGARRRARPAAARDDRHLPLVAPREHRGHLLGRSREDDRICPPGRPREVGQVLGGQRPRAPTRRTRAGGRRSSEELHDPRCDLLAGVLLDEVAGVLDELRRQRTGNPAARSPRRPRAGRSGRSRRTGRAPASPTSPAPPGSPSAARCSGAPARSAPAPGRRARPPSTPAPGTARRRRRRRRRRVRARQRVRISRPGLEVPSGRPHDLAEPKPRLARRTAAADAGVQDHEPGNPLGLLDREPQPDRPAPVLDDHRQPAQVELLDQPRRSTRSAGRTCTSSASVGLSERPKPK